MPEIRGSKPKVVEPNLKLDVWIGRTVEFLIDRPMGSTHPTHADIVYPINYGYVPGTMAADGHSIDGDNTLANTTYREAC